MISGGVTGEGIIICRKSAKFWPSPDIPQVILFEKGSALSFVFYQEISIICACHFIGLHG